MIVARPDHCCQPGTSCWTGSDEAQNKISSRLQLENERIWSCLAFCKCKSSDSEKISLSIIVHLLISLFAKLCRSRVDSMKIKTSWQGIRLNDTKNPLKTPHQMAKSRQLSLFHRKGSLTHLTYGSLDPNAINIVDSRAPVWWKIVCSAPKSKRQRRTAI